MAGNEVEESVRMLDKPFYCYKWKIICGIITIESSHRNVANCHSCNVW
jgi:hypothetical protein